MNHDPNAPRFRVRPPTGWINDPNGPFRWQGRYHLFYQHNPAAPVHDDIHWGHVSSPDLLHWEHHPIALTPTPDGPDEAGCWSGCVVDDDGVPTAVYTGIDRHHTGLGTVCLARAVVPDDETLTDWKPLPAPVLTGPPADLDAVMFRDPFVFTHDGHRWALLGAGHADGTPSVLLYDCDDLTDWRFAGVLLDGHDPVAAEAFGDRAVGWECPQLYATAAGEWTLVVSLWDGDPWTTGYLTGRLTPSPEGELRFEPHTAGRLDHGPDLYAPAVLPEPRRTLMWGWSWEAREQSEVDRAGWAGVLTAPREVDTHPDGTLRVVPARELELLRAAEPFVTLDGGGRVPLPHSCDLTVTAHGPTTVSLPTTTLRLDPDAGTVTLERADEPIVLRTPGRQLRLLVDGSLAELFLDDRATVTQRLYDAAPELVVSGAAAEVTGWELLPGTPD
ncbi:glycoside hydrolase family 32 protein [Streptomyces sp. S6]